jgi:hypothetical protein
MSCKIILPPFFDQLTKNVKLYGYFLQDDTDVADTGSNCMYILPNFWWTMDKSRIVALPLTHFKSLRLLRTAYTKR